MPETGERRALGRKFFWETSETNIVANTKQSEKRARQSQTRRLRGQAIRSRCRTMIKKTRAAVAAGDPAQARAAFVAMQAVTDSAVGKKMLHRNTAARIKLRLSRLCRLMPATPVAAAPAAAAKPSSPPPSESSPAAAESSASPSAE